jgi:16S rRNA (cytosine967-C5)-methyltransferase
LRSRAQPERRRANPRRDRPPTARGWALRALVAIERGARANVVVPQLLGAAHLETRDRHFVTELAYGTCRMRRACDWLVNRYARGTLDVEVRCALRLGAYQLGWTRVPSHAAVSETVSEIAGPGRSVVNAVLRRLSAEMERGLVVWPNLATELSYPDWIVDRLTRELGTDDAVAALRTMNEPAFATTREDGYIQDAASQMVGRHLVHLMGAGHDGARILDVCAAPGGKATALAQARREADGPAAPGAGPALVAAADRSAERIRVLASNIDRLSADAVFAVLADGTQPPWQSRSFDLVLVDAPCSGLGVLRRRPDARWRVRPEGIDEMADLQRRLIESCLPLVRPGGILAYSVCTLTSAETAGIDNWTGRSRFGFRPLPPPAPPWRPAGRGALLLPQDAGTDGMFLLTMEAPRGALVG